MATGEVVARRYRHPSDLDALKAGATWEQIGAARGDSAEQARREYRAWAEGQHALHADIAMGLEDTECAEALRFASVPTETERQAADAARAECERNARMVREADAAGIPLLDGLDSQAETEAGSEHDPGADCRHRRANAHARRR
jgi:hypothetical protein